jgi:hypothetical protein
MSNRHTKQPPKGPIRFGCQEDTHPTGWNTPPRSQPRPTTLTCDEPSWHRLLGTLLSSQGTDAHPLRPFGLSSEALFVLHLTGSFSRSRPPCRARVAGTGPSRLDPRRTSASAVRIGGGHPRDQPPGSFLGVRSSLPGDIENITRGSAAHANPLVVTPVTGYARAASAGAVPALTCAFVGGRRCEPPSRRRRARRLPRRGRSDARPHHGDRASLE